MFRFKLALLALVAGALAFLAAPAAEAGDKRWRAGVQAHHGAKYSAKRSRSGSVRFVAPRSGEFHYRSHRTGKSARYARVHRQQLWDRFDRRHATRFDRRHFTHRRDDERRSDRRHWRRGADREPAAEPYYDDAPGSVVITIDGSRDETADTTGVIIENGRCAAGAYCTLRLGPLANSPKIITLNRSGRAIADPAE